jgi:hypothetical protein
MPRVRFAAVLLPLTLALAGCSSSTPAADPAPAKAAEPADSPALTTDPAGTVLPLDPEAEGMVFDPVTGLLAVAVRHPNRLVLLEFARAGAQLPDVAVLDTGALARHVGLRVGSLADRGSSTDDGWTGLREVRNRIAGQLARRQLRPSVKADRNGNPIPVRRHHPEHPERTRPRRFALDR